MLWESAHLRADFFEHFVWPAHREYHPRDTPAEWLLRYRDRNITLLPRTRSMYNAFGPLCQLMPRAHLQRFDLPALNDLVWPATLITDFDKALPFDFLARFERAFAAFIWPFLTDDRRRAFSRDYPLQLLASDLEYWIAPPYTVIEDFVRDGPLYELEDELRTRISAINAEIASDGIALRATRIAEVLWSGEAEALEVAEALVEAADQNGRLRGLIDAIRCNRVEDDYWTREREAFERAFYHKRAKTKVHFVELPEDVKIHSPWHEVDADLDFSLLEAMLDPREREVFVLLRRGNGPVDIARELGYANHTPVSKRLARIRSKAKRALL